MQVKQLTVGLVLIAVALIGVEANGQDASRAALGESQRDMSVGQVTAAADAPALLLYAKVMGDE